MITCKNNRIYTEEDLNAYISSLSSAETDTAIRELGYINASAFKGYGKLGDNAAAYNGLIYRIKQTALEILVEKSDDVIYNSHSGILYFRLTNGIQVSFHIPYWQDDTLFRKYKGEVEWDGVPDSYTYDDIDAYEEAHQEYLRKKSEDAAKNEERKMVALTAIREYLKNGNRRKSLGMTMTQTEFNTFNPFPWGFIDLVSALIEYGVKRNLSLTAYNIETMIGFEKWKELNTFNLKQE